MTVSTRDVLIGRISLNLLELFPQWELATADRVAERLVDDCDLFEFERQVEADIASLPTLGEAA